MNLLQKLEVWGDKHHPKWLDIIRIALGIFLCYKGIDFLRNSSTLSGLMAAKTPFGSFPVILLSHYVMFAHMLGGFLMIIGMFTRFACLIQIPVLIGAIIFINSSSEAFKPYSELFFSILILLLLIYFLIVGNGPIAVKLEEEEKKR